MVFNLVTSEIHRNRRKKMKTYVTFGQDHIHNIKGKRFDFNCVAVVNGDREKVFEIFGPKFCFEYPEALWDETLIRFYPSGYIEVEDTSTIETDAEVVLNDNEKFLAKIWNRGDFGFSDDGLLQFWPEGGAGYLTSYALRVIADYLDTFNKRFEEETANHLDNLETPHDRQEA